MLLYLLYSVTDNKYFLSPSLLLNWYCILLLQIMSRVYLSKTPLCIITNIAIGVTILAMIPIANGIIKTYMI